MAEYSQIGFTYVQILGVAVLTVVIAGFALFYWRRLHTAHKNIENLNTQLKELHEHHTVLVSELHHRIKNNMYTVSNMLHLQAASVDNHEAQAILNTAVHRLISMNTLYEKLYQSSFVGEISLQQYIDTLAHEILSATSNRKIRLHIEVENIPVDAKKVSSIGIIINEAMTNAIKHAFADNNDPHIHINSHRTDSGISLEIFDNGCGLHSISKGFGMELIELSARQLKSSFRIDGEYGTHINLQIPL